MKWIVYSIERTYEVDGTEQEAEDVRVQQARRHAAVFRKAEDTTENRAAMNEWKEKHRSRSAY